MSASGNFSTPSERSSALTSFGLWGNPIAPLSVHVMHVTAMSDRTFSNVRMT